MSPNPGNVRTTRYVVAAIAALFIASVLFVFPEQYNRLSTFTKEKTGVSIGTLKSMTPFVYGLDLRGGAHLVYEADTHLISEDVAGAVEGVRDVIERRVNSLGVSEPVVQTNQAGDKWRIIVELAGVKDVTDAIKAIGETPVLEFKELSDKPPRTLTAEEKANLVKTNEAQKGRATELLLKALAPGQDFAELAKANSEDAQTKEKGGVVGEVKLDGVFGKLASLVKLNKPGTVGAQVVENEEGFNIVKLNGTREVTEVEASHLLICFKGATGCTLETSETDARVRAEELYAQAKPANFAELAVKNSTEPGADSSKGYLGYFEKEAMVKEFADVAFAMNAGEISKPVKTQFGYHLVYKTNARTVVKYDISRLLIKKTTERDIIPPNDLWVSTGLTGSQLKKAELNFNQTSGIAVVGIEFNEEGTALFAAITKRNVGKQVAIFLDGQSISEPVVNEEIPDGHAVIQGNFTVDTAKKLAQRLNAGALPVPVSLVSQSTIGASLGEKTLDNTMRAGLIGFVLIALFMVLYYRLPGIVAVISLVLYTLISLVVFKIIPVTLTAAAIAGFILSIGMAIDANVLIFERIKEELQAGRGLKDAVEEGFHRAWFSIRASNTSSIMTSLVLMSFSASVVRGFAITLTIGILISVFSAVTVTRYLMRFIVQFVPAKAIFFLGANKQH